MGRGASLSQVDEGLLLWEPMGGSLFILARSCSNWLNVLKNEMLIYRDLAYLIWILPKSEDACITLYMAPKRRDGAPVLGHSAAGKLKVNQKTCWGFKQMLNVAG